MNRIRSTSPFLAFVLAVGGALSCSSGGGSSTTSGPTPTIAISLTSSGATVTVGGSATVTGTLTRGGGFTGDVILTVEGVPAGVTGTVSNIFTSGATSKRHSGQAARQAPCPLPVPGPASEAQCMVAGPTPS